MKKEKYYRLLKKEIINDPTKQEYDKILKRRYKNLKEKFTELAQKINEKRAKELNFPIVRRDIVIYVLGGK